MPLTMPPLLGLTFQAPGVILNNERHQARIQGVGAGGRAHPWGGVSPFKMHYSIALMHQSITGAPTQGRRIRGGVRRGSLLDLAKPPPRPWQNLGGAKPIFAPPSGRFRRLNKLQLDSV